MCAVSADEPENLRLQISHSLDRDRDAAGGQSTWLAAASGLAAPFRTGPAVEMDISVPGLGAGGGGGGGFGS